MLLQRILRQAEFLGLGLNTDLCGGW